jgi:hypothetical protein
VLKKATAEAEADKLRASAEKARAMVPVEVRRAEVDVERTRVETVVKPELEAREKHGKVAQDFEIAKMQVEAEKEVRIAMANASATMFSKVSATLYGTPEQVTTMMKAMTDGQAFATRIESAVQNLGEETKAIAHEAARTLTSMVGKDEPKPASKS